MKQKYVIGIDVSKSKLDIAILNNQLELLQERVILNNSKSIRAFIKAVLNTYRITRGEVLICCENTGIYNRPLEVVCSELDVLLWVEHALKIKWATTDMRGKDDRKDALRIAQYAIRYNDKLIPYREATEVIKQLNILTKAREAILGQKTALENRLKEAKTHDVFEYQILSKSFKKVLNALVKSIKQTEEKIEQLIANAPEISQTKALITTIPGIGPQCAVNLIIATNNFTSFQSARHLACYAGVVPFKNQSGTIVKKERVSKMANKNIKKLLHLAAMASIRFDEEIKEYYQRKVSEGKNKMSVLNAVRNKLVHRIMSVVNRKQAYLSKNEYRSQKTLDFTCLIT
ncbi:hypothetical protein AM493_11810 [Flavobacterium akiainvivens]|uniref:Uncharacterized protein n=2 Tax=Flavobacterium akiainvivens TaxID=1202724 RepID=A0A0M8MI08_9FLAO|nr:IS110 family transposase [Flavobacterium akiainvivens]KOS06641.1 hypothetical protein AM493_11810 [Flavobacterium akiainvivens]